MEQNKAKELISRTYTELALLGERVQLTVDQENAPTLFLRRRGGLLKLVAAGSGGSGGGGGGSGCSSPVHRRFSPLLLLVGASAGAGAGAGAGAACSLLVARFKPLGGKPIFYDETYDVQGLNDGTTLEALSIKCTTTTTTTITLLTAIHPTIAAAANTFPSTHVMILLYYANYVVPAHGQWCILMAIDAQRCAVTINQSSFGYANSVQPGKQVQGDRAGVSPSSGIGGSTIYSPAWLDIIAFTALSWSGGSRNRATFDLLFEVKSFGSFDVPVSSNLKDNSRYLESYCVRPSSFESKNNGPALVNDQSLEGKRNFDGE
ncbi:hypothetical protein M0804_000068 [Polistes exclamans]|nr:hypothetical protein M0804_000068 [Polistes exclamans]